MQDIPPNISTVIVAILGSTLVVNIFQWLHDGLRKLFGNPKVKNEDIMNSLKKLEEVTKKNEESIKELERSTKENLDRLKNKIDLVDKKSDRNDAKSIRARILRFNNEIVAGVSHTKEDWIDCLGAIDEYENYCLSDSNFKNGYAVGSIENLKETFKKLEREHKLI